MMSKQQRQHLSALVDGEVAPALVHTTVSALASNGRLRAAWENYHLIGAALRSEQVRSEYRLIAARVSERIAVEPIPLQRPAAYRRRAFRIGPLVGAVLTAVAAVAAIVAVPKLFHLGPDVELTPSRYAASFMPEQFRLSGPAKRWHVNEPALESKLDRFLVHHQEQSPVSHMKGFLPYATLVGYETRR